MRHDMRPRAAGATTHNPTHTHTALCVPAYSRKLRLSWPSFGTPRLPARRAVRELVPKPKPKNNLQRKPTDFGDGQVTS